MTKEKKKKGYELYWFMAIALTISGVVFFHNYVISKRINDPNTLSALLKNNNLYQEAKKQTSSPKINTTLIEGNEKFVDLEEIRIDIKSIEELSVGKTDPFQPSMMVDNVEGGEQVGQGNIVNNDGGDDILMLEEGF